MIGVVASYTLKDILKSKIMVVALIIAAMTLLVSFVASELAYGVPGKIALEFGMGCISITSLIISIVLGVNLIFKELENRTIYMVLSRPISRAKFIIGKLIGFSVFLALFISLLGVINVLMYILYEGNINGVIVLAFVNMFLEACLTLFFVVLFSLLVNQTLAFIFTVSVLIAGYSIGSVRELGLIQENMGLVRIADIYSFFLPDFDRINLRPYVIYEQTLTSSVVYTTTAYAIVYLLILGFVIIKIFGNKNLD